LSGQDGAGEPSLNPAAIVAALNRHQVRYVIIGAFAAIAQQAPIPATRDIDFTPEASQENLARLSRALTDLGARLRTEAVPEGLPFSHDATSLAAAEVWNLVCADGDRAEQELLALGATRVPGEGETGFRVFAESVGLLARELPI
jgi:hypothetical protein